MQKIYFGKKFSKIKINFWDEKYRGRKFLGTKNSGPKFLATKCPVIVLI